MAFTLQNRVNYSKKLNIEENKKEGKQNDK